MRNYGDMRQLPRPESRRPKMQRQDRAKIFAPFAALSGHESAIHAREQVLVPKIEKTAYGTEILDQVLRDLQRGDMVTVTWFCPLRQHGTDILGEYRTVTGMVERLDIYDRMIYLCGQRVSFDDLEKVRKLPET